jgi:glycosyltransferase involved in cell wall biosynthesis
MGLMSSILFYRDLRQYAGGHQKVFDYFRHCLDSGLIHPQVHFSAASVFDESNPWREWQQHCVDHYDPSGAAAVFLAGVDWRTYLPLRPSARQPVINLVQHVRHADPDADVYPFLSERAIRICVSPEVADAIAATGRVNGPIFTIPNGVDSAALLAARCELRPLQAYILGNKQPQLAEELARRLREQKVTVLVHSSLQRREEVLAAMASSAVTIALPHATEGFYLPALEAMALSDVCIVPDCVGNRSFCQHQENCLMPSLDLDALLASYWQARGLLDSGGARNLRREARATLEYHSLDREREAFLHMLTNMEQLW